MAVANYTGAKGHFPPAFVNGPDGKPWHSWRVLLLPYIEGDAIYKQYRFDEPWNGPNNKQLADQMPRLFAFHGTEFPNTITNYLAVVGKDTMWPGAEGRKQDEITDGTSNTILIVENWGLRAHWMEPRDLIIDTMNFDLDAPDGISSWYEHPAVVMADDTVRRLARGMSRAELRAALTINDGAKIDKREGGLEALPDGRMRQKKP